ncbi:MAG TPA: Clp protease N-terminal domain-containing protein, partial [Acidimicrobiales bacterium]
LREALALKHREIAAEHVLLGIVREGEGLAALILTKHGIELEDLRRQVISRLGAGAPGRKGRFRRVPGFSAMTAGAATASERAAALAGDEPVASHHYLRALVEDTNSAAARTLAALGVTPEAIEAKLAEVGTAGTTDAPPNQPERAGRAKLAVEGESIVVELAEPDLARRLRPLLSGRAGEVPGSETLWRAVLPALANVANQLESMPSPDPPGWSEAGVAALSVTSIPDGPGVRFWARPGADTGAVKAFLADWLRQRPAGDDCNYLTVTLGEADDGRVVLSGFSSGIAPDRPGWRTRPVSQLVAAALAALEPEG